MFSTLAQVFLTCGDEGVVAKWRKEKVDWKLTVGSKPCSADFHPSGVSAVVGTVDGHFLSVNGVTGFNLKTVFVGDFALTAVRFNPSGNLVAVAAETGIIFLYSVTDSGKGFRKCGRINCSTRDQSYKDFFYCN